MIIEYLGSYEKIKDVIQKCFNALTNRNKMQNDVKSMSNSGASTAFLEAADKGDLNCLKDLIKMGVNINTKDKDGYTALMLASREGHSDCVDALVSHNNIDINATNLQGKTTLTFAREYNKLECIKLLEQAKINSSK